MELFVQIILNGVGNCFAALEGLEPRKEMIMLGVRKKSTARVATLSVGQMIQSLEVLKFRSESVGFMIV